MKQKISITLDELSIRELEQLIESGQYRNRSHVLEFALKQLLNK